MTSAFTIRKARKSDEPVLAWLGALAGQPPVPLPALIGDLDGIPAAAIAMADGRLVADPFRPLGELRQQLRAHRAGWRMQPAPDALRRSLRAALPFMV